MSQLIRKKKLVGERIGHTWFTSKEDVSAYLSTKKFVSADTVAVSMNRYFLLIASIYALVIMGILIGSLILSMLLAITSINEVQM